MFVEPQPPRTRNPHTKARIDREAFWQIWLPMGVIGVLILVAVVLVSASGGALVRSPIADVSLVALIVVWAMFALVGFIIVCALIVGVYWLLRESPYWFKRGQDISWIVSQQTRSTTRQVEDVVTSANAGTAGLMRLLERLRDLFPKG